MLKLATSCLSVLTRATWHHIPEHGILLSSYLKYCCVSNSVRFNNHSDHLCVLVVRVPGYRPRGPRFDSRCYQTFWEVVGLELGPLSLMRITEELLERKAAPPVWKTEINGHREPIALTVRYPLCTKLALTSLTSSSRSFGIVYWQTKTPPSLFFNNHSYLMKMQLPLAKHSINFSATVQKQAWNYCTLWWVAENVIISAYNFSDLYYEVWELLP
jgi:hypothetical protein